MVVIGEVWAGDRDRLMGMGEEMAVEPKQICNLQEFQSATQGRIDQHSADLQNQGGLPGTILLSRGHSGSLITMAGNHLFFKSSLGSERLRGSVRNSE